MPFNIVREDITHLQVDAIVNAANNQLMHGGGVCGAIFKAAGPRRLQAACDKIGYCETGQAAATSELLASCYRTSLKLAAQLKCRSIAFPLISSGIYGYPKREALEVAQQEIRAFLDAHEMDVTLVLYDTSVMEIADDLRLRVERYIDDVYVSAHARQSSRRRWETEQPWVSANTMPDWLNVEESVSAAPTAAESVAPSPAATAKSTGISSSTWCISPMVSIASCPTETGTSPASI